MLLYLEHSDIYQLISMYDWIFSFFFAPSISSKVLMAFLLNWNCLYCEELLVVIWKYHLVLCWTSWEKMSCRRTWTRSPNIYIRRVKMLDTELMFKLFFSPQNICKIVSDWIFPTDYCFKHSENQCRLEDKGWRSKSSPTDKKTQSHLLNPFLNIFIYKRVKKLDQRTYSYKGLKNKGGGNQ